MIEVQVSASVKEEARRRSEDMGKLRNSITGGDGNMAGFIGEALVATYLGDCQWNNTYDYDIVYGGIKIDVKTKRTNFRPRKDFECSVSAFNPNQKCDWYVFVRVMGDFSRAWILGYIPHETFSKTAKFYAKGDIDPRNGWTVKSSCYSVEIKDLWDLAEAKKGKDVFTG